MVARPVPRRRGCLLRISRPVHGMPAIGHQLVHGHVVAEFAQDVRELRQRVSMIA